MFNLIGAGVAVAVGVIWDVGWASFALGTTLVCRDLMKMMAATRMISIVTRKAITTGLMDESPTRCSGVGLLVVGFCSLMEWLDAEATARVRWAGIRRDLFSLIYSSRPGRDMSSRI